MITSGFEVLVNSQYMIEMNKAMEGKALTGSAFRNLTMKTVVDCFLACLKDCLCISFQMCNETECQLLSSSQFQSTLDNIIECTYYDMFPSSAKQVRNSYYDIVHRYKLNLIFLIFLYFFC